MLGLAAPGRSASVGVGLGSKCVASPAAWGSMGALLLRSSGASPPPQCKPKVPLDAPIISVQATRVQKREEGGTSYLLSVLLPWSGVCFVSWSGVACAICARKNGLVTDEVTYVLPNQGQNRRCKHSQSFASLFMIGDPPGTKPTKLWTQKLVRLSRQGRPGLPAERQVEC